MLEKKLQQKYVARSNEDVATYVGKKQKLIVVEKPLENIPQGYTQVTMLYKGERRIFLIPEKAKFFMANPGEDGKPLEALDELADFYAECSDFEHELQLGGTFSVTQTNVSTLARNSYAVWAINQLVKQQRGSETPEWNDAELDRLGVNDSYISDRLQGIAALMLGKNVQDMQETGLDGLLVHKTAQGTYKEILSEKEFNEITCWAGSHYELKEQYRNEEHGIEHRHDLNHKKGWKISHEKEFSHLPSIEKLEEEIEGHRQKQGKEITRHDKALLRTLVNMKYIAKENPAKQLDVMENA